MRQRLHYGRGNRKPFSRWAVIPHGWDDQHRPVVEGTMTARVSIRRPGPAGITWDPDLEQDVSTPHTPHFEGWARVQRTSGMGANPVTAGDPEPLGDFLVAVPADADQAEAGDLVTLSLSGDPILDQTPLFVAHVTVGSLRFERDLYCTFNPQTPAPTVTVAAP